MAWRYDLVPKRCFQKKILDIGTGQSNNQIKCKNKDYFLQANYLGIDLNPPNNGLTIIQADFFSWAKKTTKTFDILLIFEFIEHIPIRDWPPMFELFKKLLNKEGEIFLTTPYKERLVKYKKWILDPVFDYYQKHVVFDLTPTIIHWFLPGAKIKKRRHYYIREPGESIFWGIARYIKRVFIRHEFIRRGIFPRSYKSLIVHWKNK